MNFLSKALAAAGLATLSLAASAATNILSTEWSWISTTGWMGTLRASSGWESGASLASQASIVDGAFLPESTQWNSGSWWWDADASVNSAPVVTVIALNDSYALNSFSVQADDNDTYRIEYWDGAAWQLAWDVPVQPSWGLTTRTSGLLPSITTNQLRFTATGGDNFYAVAEIQAFGSITRAVPEPETYALMLAGLAAVGFVARRKKQG